jgi:DNA-binding transcriptional regulator YhcF (GntR family)
MTLDKRSSFNEAPEPELRSPIEFRLDPASGVPTYLQLVQQVEHALLLGYLQADDRLPKVRDVVADLAINPNTVLKAYRDLEGKGLAVGRPGQGTFIQADVHQTTLPELSRLRRKLRRWVVDAGSAGLDEHMIVALFTTTLRDVREHPVVAEADADPPRSAPTRGDVA